MTRAERRPPLAALPWTVPVVAGWALVVVAGHLLGSALYASDPFVHIGAPPLVGGFDVRLSARVLPALALAVAAVAWAGALADRPCGSRSVGLSKGETERIWLPLGP